MTIVQGYPGNLIASVVYTLDNEGNLKIVMQVYNQVLR